MRAITKLYQEARRYTARGQDVAAGLTKWLLPPFSARAQMERVALLLLCLLFIVLGWPFLKRHGYRS